MVSQQFSPVCWLASALMVMQFKQGCTLSTEDLARRAGLQGPDFRTPGLTVASEYPTGPQQNAVLTRLGFSGNRLEALSSNLVRSREQEARRAQATQQGRQRASMAPSRMRHSDPNASSSSTGDIGQDAIYSVLQNHGPFVLLHNVGSFSYGSNLRIPPQAMGSGHAVVVTGFFPDLGRVTFNNPWGQSDVPTTIASIIGAMRRWEGRTTANKSIYWLWAFPAVGFVGGRRVPKPVLGEGKQPPEIIERFGEMGANLSGASVTDLPGGMKRVELEAKLLRTP